MSKTRALFFYADYIIELSIEGSCNKVPYGIRSTFLSFFLCLTKSLQIPEFVQHIPVAPKSRRRRYLKRGILVNKLSSQTTNRYLGIFGRRLSRKGTVAAVLLLPSSFGAFRIPRGPLPFACQIQAII